MLRAARNGEPLTFGRAVGNSDARDIVSVKWLCATASHRHGDSCQLLVITSHRDRSHRSRYQTSSVAKSLIFLVISRRMWPITSSLTRL